jgi:hypothetical protein
MKNMPRICLIAVLIMSCMLSFLPVCAQGPKEKAPPVKLFQEKSAGYTLEYPADWAYESPDKGTFVFSGPSGTRAFYSTVSFQNLLSDKSGGKYRDVDSVVSDLISQFATAAGSKRPGISPYVYSKGGTRLAGKEFVVEYVKEGTRFKQWVIVLPTSSGRILRTWFYTSPEAQYDEFLNTAKAILNSWTIID